MGIVLFVLFISEIFLYYSKKESFTEYKGPVSNIWIDTHTRISKERHSFLDSDTTYYNDFHIKLNNYPKTFKLVGIGDQFLTIKRLISESNYVVIRAQKDFFWRSKLIVYQMDSDRRENIIYLDETTRQSKDFKWFLLVMSLLCFTLPLYRWLRLKSLKSHEFDQNLYLKALARYTEMKIEDLQTLYRSTGLSEEEKLALGNTIYDKTHSG